MLDKYDCVRLTDPFQFDLDGFSSRDENMNKWLRDKALDYHESGHAAVWVLTPLSGDTGVVSGFFTLSNTKILREKVPRKKRAGSNAAASLSEIPATLIGKFAVDRSLHGGSISDLLMLWAQRKACEAAEHVGSSYLVVELRGEAESIAFLRQYYIDRFKFFPLNRGEPLRLQALAKRLEDVRSELDLIGDL